MGYRIALLIAVIPGLGMGWMAVSAAWWHNTERMVHNPETGYVDVPYLALIFGSWFLVGFVPLVILGIAFVFLFRLVTKSNS